MVKESFFILLSLFCFYPAISGFAETNGENTVSAILTAKVTTTIEPAGEQGMPISNARLVVINSLGKIIATKLTNSKGEATLPVIAPKDLRFPMKNMGEVTVIAVANGYNEHIDFSVPINEYNDHTGRVSISLWKIDPKRRNEPQFLNASFHRFTVFDMLDYYAAKIGLKRQYINDESIAPAPWGPAMTLE
ncbi:carboxypeptidase-like regulatory domain-containing protein [Neobacillus soli]|uniref:carboxypeptidase-like regulatory domain-containing protein n=1 Tax=Neobacillus soli TaxID=220688 RepID=UPI000824A2DF|nr:carboxypeptidase-like regulatory domain-containing protein [Neobacillus soli]